MTIFAYPIFLLLFVFLLTRRYRQMSILQWIGRWLLAIGLAYWATIGLTLALIGSVPDYDFRSPLKYYWYGFVRQAFGLMLLIVVLGLSLLVLDRFWQRSTRLSIEAESNGSFKRTAWVFTFILLTSLTLITFLVIEPYLDFHLNIDRVYAETKGCCLDPTAWFPFSGEGFGSFLYDMSFWVWSLAAYFLIPIALTQLFVLKNIWPKLQHIEKMAHITSAATAILAALFILTIGTDTLYWLID